MAEPMLSVYNINVWYGAIHAIKDISFNVNEGEIVALIGANGAGKSTTLKTVSGLLRSKTGSIKFMGEDITHTPADKLVAAAVKNGSEDVRVLLGHFDGMASETLSSVFATLSSKTMIFASDPDIMRCFNSDRVIRPEDLLDGSTTIFLQIPEHRLEVYRNVTQLIIGQFLKFWEQQPDGSAPRVNFILDEFFRLGKLSSVENGLATLRSKGVRIHAITQSLAQIEQLYERVGARALADNFTVKVLLGATEPESQKYFADLIGSYDKAMRSTSSSQQLANFGGSAGVSWSEQERKIIRPEQLARLGNECILFASGGWSRVQKRPYYATKELQN